MSFDPKNDPRLTCTGEFTAWLTKSKSENAVAKWFSSATKRQFTIDFSSQLFYYVSDVAIGGVDKADSRRVNFKDISCAEQLPNTVSSSTGNPFGFRVATSDRTWELYTHSYNDAQLWVSALNAASDIGNGRVPAHLLQAKSMNSVPAASVASNNSAERMPWEPPTPSPPPLWNQVSRSSFASSSSAPKKEAGGVVATAQAPPPPPPPSVDPFAALNELEQLAGPSPTDVDTANTCSAANNKLQAELLREARARVTGAATTKRSSQEIAAAAAAEVAKQAEEARLAEEAKRTQDIRLAREAAQAEAAQKIAAPPPPPPPASQVNSRPAASETAPAPAPPMFSTATSSKDPVLRTEAKVIGIAPPAGGIAPPAGGIAPPAGGIAPPAGGVAPPAGGIAPPAGSALSSTAAPAPPPPPQKTDEDSDWDEPEPTKEHMCSSQASTALTGPVDHAKVAATSNDWDDSDHEQESAAPLPPPPSAVGAPTRTASDFVPTKKQETAATEGDELDDLVDEMLAADTNTAVIGHGLVPNYHCTGCDFQVLVCDDYVWNADVEYMFFRNNYPTFEKLRRRLTRQTGCKAYCCQCSWKSARAAASLSDVADGLKWRVVKF